MNMDKSKNIEEFRMKVDSKHRPEMQGLMYTLLFN